MRNEVRREVMNEVMNEVFFSSESVLVVGGKRGRIDKWCVSYG